MRSSVAIPALQPDVALLHAQCADADGNLQLFGLPGDSVEGALASRKVIATVEEIVPPEVIRQPAGPHRGARFSGRGRQPRAVWRLSRLCRRLSTAGTIEAYGDWDALARDPAALGAWIDRMIRDTPDFASYLKMVGPARLQAIADVFGRSTGNAP